MWYFSWLYFIGLVMYHNRHARSYSLRVIFSYKDIYLMAQIDFNKAPTLAKLKDAIRRVVFQIPDKMLENVKRNFS